MQGHSERRFYTEPEHAEPAKKSFQTWSETAKREVHNLLSA